MTILLAPLATSEGKHVGGAIFRKQVLRKGKFNYKGRELNFDDTYLSNLVKAFEEGAYPMVPFVLADEQNRHTMDPERMRGEILAFEQTPEGLDAVVRLSREAVTIAREYPNFGVSVRIVEGVERGDGYKTDVAIQHVLGTSDPRMTGLSPWAEVEMSNEDHEVIDLTGGNGMDEAELFAKFQEFMAAQKPAETENAETETAKDETVLTAEDLAKLEAEANKPSEAEKPAEAPVVAEKVPALALSNETGTVELASMRDELTQVRTELALSNWKRERAEFAIAGVPPALLDSAEILMSTPGANSIDLANGEKLDPCKVVREILTKAKGMVDLSGEMGHQGADPVVPDIEAWANAEADKLGI